MDGVFLKLVFYECYMSVWWELYGSLLAAKKSSLLITEKSAFLHPVSKNFFLVYRGAPVEQIKTLPRIRRSIGPGAVIAFKFLGLNTIADWRVIISIDNPILKGWSDYDGQRIWRCLYRGRRLVYFDTVRNNRWVDWFTERTGRLHLLVRVWLKRTGSNTRVSSTLRIIRENRIRDALVKIRDSKTINRQHSIAAAMATKLLNKLNLWFSYKCWTGLSRWTEYILLCTMKVKNGAIRAIALFR